MRMVPSFFLTNRIGAPNGDLLGWMKPALVSSSSCFFSSASSVADRRKVGRLGGVRAGDQLDLVIDLATRRQTWWQLIGEDVPVLFDDGHSEAIE